MSNKYVDFIANMITDDPCVLNEKKKSPKIDQIEIETDFDTQETLEDKDKPADPSKKDRNQKSSLNKIEGAKQTGKAEVKPKNITPKTFKNSKKPKTNTLSETIGSPSLKPDEVRAIKIVQGLLNKLV